MTPVARLGASLALAISLLVGFAPAVRAQGVDETCALALTKFDPATVNIAYPDDSAQYYAGVYQLVPGTRIRITGQFPHARYMSFNVYDPALRPLDGLSDVHVTPDAGSANPFVVGANRAASDHRAFTVFIEYGTRPAQPAPNTMYVGAGQSGSPNPQGTFIYRIYIPDNGRDQTGGVGLPTATIEQTTSSGAPTTSPCANVSKPSATGINELLAAQSPPTFAPTPAGSNPPTWRKFVNLASSIAVNATGQPTVGPLDLDTLGGSGGFWSNLDNAYLSTPASLVYGRVLVTRMRAPTYPNTRPPSATMPSGQVRYWSMCQNDPYTERYIQCANDDRSVLSTDGDVTFVLSTAADRPATATSACGVNWIPWGPDQRGLLIYRNMLPDPTFSQSVQRAKPDLEAATMGDYLPVSKYYADATAYAKATPCTKPAPGSGPAGPPSYRAAGATPPGTMPTRGAGACTSRRLIRVTLPRAYRSSRTATLRVSAWRTLRVRVHNGAVLVDLRRAPRGRLTVSLIIGHRIVDRRVFHTCAHRRQPTNPPRSHASHKTPPE